MTVRCGDAFEGIRRAGAGGGRCAGIIVDVFDEKSRVLPLLTRVETWRDIASALAPGGRVIANLSTGRGKGADLDLAVAAAEAAAVACGRKLPTPHKLLLVTPRSHPPGPGPDYGA